MLGDGLYHCTMVLIRVAYSLSTQYLKKKSSSSVNPEDGDGRSNLDYDNQHNVEYFLKDQIPNWVAFIGYGVLVIVSSIVVSHIFLHLKWYHVLVACMSAPILGFCNAYGCGLTDWSLASNYGKFSIIIFSSWVVLANGSIIAGLTSCGVMMSIVSAATTSNLMQEFKIGYLTLNSPRAIFISQVLVTTMGCLMSLLIFWFVHNPDSYSTPYGEVYRGIAFLGAKGFFSVPKHCFKLAIIFFCLAIYGY
ncbi:hypothetical protein RJT34_07480 [Clitoria ternatea]|uniref:Uncharacterized protein n=1 Tax=Clitoria ternatea TaxID=43366 RepID=A0AAN9PU15_CLITE